MTYAFSFDASACSGCKACQVACKDRNDLPVGVLWRRVYEVSGGDWERQGEAWTNSIFAYNLSLACNHCAHPHCAGVCPTDAFFVRPDGIVCIDGSKCVGCGYCAWACPYDAPQLNESLGVMTKCNLCADDLDLGLPPACVASCPMRCLELVKIDDPEVMDSGIALWEAPGNQHPFPLPVRSRTEPHLLIKPHSGVEQTAQGAQVSNREEVTPASARVPTREEIPLLLFTLLAQMAIGACWTILLIEFALGATRVTLEATLVPWLAMGGTMLAALLVSFLHLHKPRNAWRTVTHLRKSWLSREILSLTMFSGAWVILTGLRLFLAGSFALWTPLAGLTALCGLAALYSMQSIYQLRSVPGWNKTRTRFEFTVSTVLLGCLFTGMLLPREVFPVVRNWIQLPALLAFLAAGLLSLSFGLAASGRIASLRFGLNLAGLLVTILPALQPDQHWQGGILVVFLLAVVEEGIGRWLFYARRKPGI